MDNLAPLVRPAQATVSVNPTPQECPAEGFEYPTFRQLNKRARVYISPQWELEQSVPYNVFVIANRAGWSVAVKTTSSGSELLFFPLPDLRAAFASANPDSDDILSPARTLPLPGGKINALALSQDNTRLFIGSQSGLLAVFDTSQLFTSGSGDVHPLGSLQLQNNAFRQILPNPSSEQGLNDLVAVVGDGKVHLFSNNLESRGGWAATDLMSQPIAASWSPKGKQIAIGLQTGDILTFTPTNTGTPAKHIPPTANAILVSLNWLGPGHTFRTSYAGDGSNNPKQHIVTLDSKTSTAVYFEPDHPFPTHEQQQPHSYVLQLPQWDDAAGAKENNKSLLLVADSCSVDLEVLGHIGHQWYRAVQDNPLSLPLSKSMDDTIILAMAADLTDATTSNPIMYVYLNDGSLQAWHLDHSKPYPGMVIPGATSAQVQAAPADAGMSTDQGAPAPSPAAPSTGFGFGQKPAQPAFGSSGFGSASTQPAFGQSGFGGSGGGGFSAFASSSPSPFGQTNNTSNTSAFGSAAKPSGFASFASGGNTAFGAGASSSAFGSSAPSGSAFGSTAPSGGAFGNLQATNSSVFGQASFGTPANNSLQSQPSSTPSVFGQPAPAATSGSVFGQGGFAAPSASAADMTREASMSDSTTAGFGSFGLGSATPLDPTKTANSMFGAFGNTSNQPASVFGSGGGSNTESSGSVLKPASGFGAFASLGADSPFGQKKDPSAPASIFASPASTSGSTTSTPTAFGQTGFGSQPTTSPTAFGQTGFGSTGFGKTPSFGQSAFGKPSLTPATTTTAAPASGGFASFAAQKTGFGAAATAAPSTSPFAAAANKTSTATPSTGGFASFASSTPSAFGTSSTPTTTESKPTPFGAPTTPTAFGAAPPASAAEKPVASTSVFGTKVASSPSAFTAPTMDSKVSGSSSGSSEATATKSAQGPAKPSPEAVQQKSLSFSPPSSPEPEPSSPALDGKVSPTPFKTPAPATPSGGAFSNLKASPSPFHLTSGFGAFGSTTPESSPFFKKPSTTPATPPVSIFASTPDTTPTKAAPGTGFGVKSQLGAASSTSVFAALGAGKQPEPVSTTPTATPAKGGFSAFSSSGGSTSPFATFAAQQKTSFADLLKVGDGDSKDPTKKPSPKKEEAKKVVEETSYGTLSSSSSSSFVHVDDSTNEENEEEGGDQQEDEEDGDEGEFELTDEEDYEEDLPPDEGSDQEGGEEGEEDGEESGEDEHTTDQASVPPAAAVPLPASRSPSSTPQPDVPAVTLTPSPAGSPAAASRESSPTPPGTPGATSKDIKPVVSPIPSPAFGNLGIGRPSTKPTRSSPLANTISGEESEEEKPETVKPSPNTAESPTNRRPKTPPLLSSFGGGPSTTPSQPSVFAPPTKPPGGNLPFNFNTSKSATSTPAPPSVFSPPPAPATDRPASAPTFGLGLPPSTATPPSTSGPPAIQPPKPGAFGGFGTNTGSPFGLKPFSAPPSTGPTPGASTPSLFGLGAVGGPGAFNPPPPGSLFGTKLGAASAPLPTVPSVMPPPPGSFPVGGGGGMAMPSLAGRVGPPAAPSAPPAPVVPAGPSLADQMKELQDGMQKECLNIAKTMEEELNQVRAVLNMFQKACDTRFTSRGGSKDRADLLSKEKWNFVDLKQYGGLLLQVQGDMDEIYNQLDAWRLSLRDVQNGMLKATTRREEVSRFHKAKNDEEFAKMLRGRTLGPEHSETQTQLRKSIRAIKDRVQKLEGTLQEDKKKLSSAASGRAAVRAPTLDTVNRTYRNIDSAIRQQSAEIARLTDRIANLSFAEPASLQTPPRDARLPDQNSSRRPYNVTPNVAITTAAALNAEHSAQRLKKALLSVRKQPLMNTKAASTPPTLTSLTPKKPSFLGVALDAEAVPVPVPDFQDFPASDEFNPNGSFSSPSLRRHAGERPKKHSTLTPKRSPGAGLWSGASATSPGVVAPGSAPATPTPAPSTGFDWGPLANVKPVTTPPTNLPRAFVPLTGFTSPTPAKK